MTSFFPFCEEALRVAANLAQRYDAYVAAVRVSDALPRSMFFAKKDEREYLVLKRFSGDSGTAVGARSADTEATLAQYLADRDAARACCWPQRWPILLNGASILPRRRNALTRCRRRSSD